MDLQHPIPPTGSPGHDHPPPDGLKGRPTSWAEVVGCLGVTFLVCAAVVVCFAIANGVIG